MKKWQKAIVQQAIKRAAEKIEKGPETLINVFNSGFILDLKRIKVKIIKSLGNLYCK